MVLLTVVRDVGVRDKSNNHSTIVWRTLYLFEPSPLDLPLFFKRKHRLL
jgi:hypothetical protein